MVIAVQGLGKLDAMLVAKDANYLSIRQDQRDSVEESEDLTDRFTFSYLWVLGAYEIVRAIEQRCHPPSPINIATAELIRQTKRAFERMRIPLAKFEHAHRFSHTDTMIAFPALDPQDGIAWRVADDVVVLRKELSESFMKMLRALSTQPNAG